jgi:amino acid adenylation domain-containing protein
MQDQVTGFRLSSQQRRLWTLHKDEPAYRAQCAILLEGALEPAVLKEALQRVVMRHEILRTTFRRLAGMRMPVQVVADAGTFVLEELDATSLGDEQQDQRIEDLLWHEASLGFDLEQGPALRALLSKVSDHRFVLVLSVPALCADARSLQNLVQEISKCYDQGLEDEQSSGEVMQYARFSEWQAELLEEDDATAGKEFWQSQRLPNAKELKIVNEKTKQEKRRYSPKVFRVAIGAALVEKIEETARECEANAADVLLGCLQVLLWRLSGQQETIVCRLCDGRKYEALQDGLGLYAKWLPVRCHFDEGLQFADAVKQVRQSTAEGYGWSEYFIPDGEATGSSIGFEFQRWAEKDAGNGVLFSFLKQYTCFEWFKVRLTCIQKDEAISAEFHYDASILSSDDIKRLAGELLVLAGSAVSNPRADISRLEILTNAERERLLVEFNDTKADYPRQTAVYRLIEQQAQRTPKNLAVAMGKQQLSFSELNSRANQLANHLKRSGVGRETLVAICIERSIEMIVGMLGVLKAGGTYVPLDSTYPERRLAFMLEDSGAPVLLTQQRLLKSLPQFAGTIICLDSDWETIAKESHTNPTDGVEPDNLAYVIYTSGSTGNPKGVMIPHGGLVNYLNWSTRAYLNDAGGGALVHSPLGFDLTITSLFCPLLNGQRLELVREEEGIEGLSALLRAGNYSLLKLTPSHLEVLSQWLSAEEIAGRIETLVIGGEALLGESLGFWRANAPEMRIINEYGPTETVVGCCVYEPGRNEKVSGSVPIGKPIANTQLYILDKELQAVPIGATGELHIAGAGLARGYLNRPDVSAEKFIPNPFSKESGARLYKTGDVARYRPDGVIEFLGRNDEQVKIRGYRIELGEIEFVLSSHPEIRDAVVVAHEDSPGERRLIAYVVKKEEPGPSITDLRDYMNDKLPAYMIPSALVMLKGLPLTANGKVDRRALPAPDHARPELEQSYAPPNTAVEEILVSIWVEVLGIEQVGIHDSFFALGGDSIRSVRVVALAKELGLDFTVQQLFQHQTISELAQEFERTVGLSDSTEQIEQYEDTAQLLEQLESLSEEEVKAMLREKMRAVGT